MNADKTLDIIKKIVDKKFEKKEKGYSPIEVDTTIDEIFEHIKPFLIEYNELGKKYQNLEHNFNLMKDKFDKSEAKCKHLEAEIERLESSGASMHVIKNEMNKMQEVLDSLQSGNEKDKK